MGHGGDTGLSRQSNVAEPMREEEGRVTLNADSYTGRASSYLILLAGQCLGVERGASSLMETSLTKLLTMVQVGNVRGFRVIPALQNSLISSCLTTHLREEDPHSPEIL